MQEFKSWSEDFPEIKEGFDIVIGNPPYISYYGKKAISLSQEERQYFKNNYESVKTVKDRINSMNLMLERGLQLLKTFGHLSFIVNKTLAVLPSYIDVRKFILSNSKFSYFVTNLRPFDAIVDCIILGLNKTKADNYDFKWLEGNFEKFIIKNCEIFQLNSKYEFHYSEHQEIISKIQKAPNTLKDLITINRGINIGGCSKDFLSDIQKNEDYQKFLAGTRNIKRYSYQWHESGGYFFFDTVREQELRKNGNTIGLGKKARYEQERLFIPQSGKYLMAAYCNENYYCGYGIMVGTQSNFEYSLKYACALLNSKLFTFYAIETEILRAGAMIAPQIRAKDLYSIPVYLCDENIEDSIVELVDRVLTLKSENKDTSIFEREIDALIYKLYNLTYEEVLVIEPEFSLSKKEYFSINI